MKLTADREEAFRLKLSKKISGSRIIYDGTLSLNSHTIGQDANQIYAAIYELKAYVTGIFNSYVDIRIFSYRDASTYPDDQDLAKIVNEFHCIAESQVNHFRSYYEGCLSEAMKRNIPNILASTLDELKQDAYKTTEPFRLFILEGRIKETDRNSDKVLQWIFELADKDIGMSHTVLRENIGLPADIFDRVIENLEKKYFIEYRDGVIRITKQGIKYLKEKRLVKLNPETKVTKTKNIIPTNKVDLSFIADTNIRKIIERDYAELQQLDSSINPKSVLVMSGSIIEGLLIDALTTKGDFPSVTDCNKFLKELIHPALQAGIIQHDNLSDVLRKFRNLIHPVREVKDNLSFNQTHANLSRAAVDVIISEVREWHSNRTKTITR
jgi:hypothetical protein